jgi:hypothetical protein
MEFIIAAISLGFLGSLHCIGMCGPIALALPVHHKAPYEKLFSILFYNWGRIVTYSLFGVLFGSIGQSFRFFGYQQIFSILIGVLILILLLLSRFFPLAGSGTYQLFNSVKNKMAWLFHKHGMHSFFSIGLLNGLLPCGMVYVAIAGAAATGSVYKGALFMAVFGAGTLPLMMALNYFGHIANNRIRNLLRQAVPFTVGIMAILLILRGANIGISYISPKIADNAGEGKKEQVLKCCHK